MKKNMGTIDRVVRLLVVVLIVVLYSQEVISGTLAIVLGVVAGIFALTSVISFCPLYKIVGLSTCPVKK